MGNEIWGVSSSLLLQPAMTCRSRPGGLPENAKTKSDRRSWCRNMGHVFEMECVFCSYILYIIIFYDISCVYLYDYIHSYNIHYTCIVILIDNIWYILRLNYIDGHNSQKVVSVATRKQYGNLCYLPSMLCVCAFFWIMLFREKTLSNRAMLGIYVRFEQILRVYSPFNHRLDHISIRQDNISIPLPPGFTASWPSEEMVFGAVKDHVDVTGSHWFLFVFTRTR